MTLKLSQAFQGTEKHMSKDRLTCKPQNIIDVRICFESEPKILSWKISPKTTKKRNVYAKL